jgi:hypothetical protein
LRGDSKYTKDYIQLSRTPEFLGTIKGLFPALSDEGSVSLSYKWPTGAASGTLVLESSDRPHLKWETRLGAPKVWNMSLSPSNATAETIPGDPTHITFDAAEGELAMLAGRGAGQPYLMAIKLHDEPATLHLRAYLDGPSAPYAWADLKLTPLPVQELAARTSKSSALAWKTFASGDGLFFDPIRNHDAWIWPAPIPQSLATPTSQFLDTTNTQFPALVPADTAAEVAESDTDEVETFQKQIENKNYSVADSTATMKTRGSAQRAFANAVKSNYGYRCAITGIKTNDFLVAAHIVPWSEDQSIRLDPSNGICLSLLMDCAFEKGYLLIEDDLSIRINWFKVGNDAELCRQLEPYDGKKLIEPKAGAAHPTYLERRRALVALAV